MATLISEYDETEMPLDDSDLLELPDSPELTFMLPDFLVPPEIPFPSPTTLLPSPSPQTPSPPPSQPTSATLPPIPSIPPSPRRRYQRASSCVRRPSLRMFWSPLAPVRIELPSLIQNLAISGLIARSARTHRAIFLLDASARMVCASPSFVKVFNPSHNPNFSYIDLVSPECFARCYVFKKTLSAGLDIRGVDAFYVLPDGRKQKVWVNLYPVFDANNKSVAIRSEILCAEDLEEFMQAMRWQTTQA